MNYVWEVLLAARETEIGEAGLHFYPEQAPNPYVEVSFAKMNTSALEDAEVGVNPLYRFNDIFSQMFAPDIHAYEKARSLFLDVFMHYMARSDLLSGMHRQEYYLWFLREELLGKVYGGRADAYTIPYRKQLADTNAFVVSESGKLCTVLHVRQKQGDTENLYLTKPAAIEASEGERKGYVLYCVDKRTSDELYRLYRGGQNVVPEHLRVWKIPLMDFLVKEPVSLPLPMAVDFGSVNTTAGVYLDTAYMEKIGRMAGVLGLKENAVNYTLFDETGKDEMLLPSVIGVTAVEDADYWLAFGRKAVELAAASYIDEGFCVFTILSAGSVIMRRKRRSWTGWAGADGSAGRNCSGVSSCISYRRRRTASSAG